MSGILGRPVAFENRARIGVSCWKCWAIDRVDASGVGVNLPFRRSPFACAYLCEGSVRLIRSWGGLM